jgi:hypothetical protein
MGDHGGDQRKTHRGDGLINLVAWGGIEPPTRLLNRLPLVPGGYQLCVVYQSGVPVSHRRHFKSYALIFPINKQEEPEWLKHYRLMVSTSS